MFDCWEIYLYFESAYYNWCDRCDAIVHTKMFICAVFKCRRMVCLCSSGLILADFFAKISCNAVDMYTFAPVCKHLSNPFRHANIRIQKWYSCSRFRSISSILPPDHCKLKWKFLKKIHALLYSLKDMVFLHRIVAISVINFHT